VQLGDAGRRHHPDRVHDRAQRAQKHGEALPAQRLGDHGQRLGIRSRHELPAALVPR